MKGRKTMTFQIQIYFWAFSWNRRKVMFVWGGRQQSINFQSKFNHKHTHTHAQRHSHAKNQLWMANISRIYIMVKKSTHYCVLPITASYFSLSFEFSMAEKCKIFSVLFSKHDLEAAHFMRKYTRPSANHVDGILRTRIYPWNPWKNNSKPKLSECLDKMNFRFVIYKICFI